MIPEDQHEAAGKQEGETSHIERWINTLSQRLSRFVSKTLSFSKSHRMHYCCLELFICRCNHRTDQKIQNLLSCTFVPCISRAIMKPALA